MRGRERHPSSQGKVEAVNKSLKRTLTRMSLDRDEDWIFLLDECTSVYNNTKNSSIGVTPFEALYGIPKVITGAGQTSGGKRRVPTEAAVRERREKYKSRRTDIRVSVSAQLEKARQRMIRKDIGEIPKLMPGSIAMQDVPFFDRGRALALSAIPVMILKEMKNDVYRVMYKDGSVCQRGCHISTLKPVDDTQWHGEWARAYEAREGSKKPVRSAVKLYYPSRSQE